MGKNMNRKHIVNIDIDSVETTGIKHNYSKFDYDLFNDERRKLKEKVVRVKRISVGKQERWKIIEDGKVILVLEGTKFSKKEKEYLRSADGFNFLIKRAKLGIKSFNQIKKELKMLVA